MTPDAPPRSRWVGAWPDALAFAGGLFVAWWFDWDTADLIWSLWLSSLVVGSASVIWIVSEPLREFAVNLQSGRAKHGPWAKAGLWLFHPIRMVLALAFFAVHFGGAHFGHAAIMQDFFPVDGKPFAGWITMFSRIVAGYWYFLPMAFMAERAAFRPLLAPPVDGTASLETTGTRKSLGSGLWVPYRNVVRMHLLIFFFAIARAKGLENFLIYAVVYVVYFFPWRRLLLLKGSSRAPGRSESRKRKRRR